MDSSGYQDLLNNSIINADDLIVNSIQLPNLAANSVLYLDSTNTVQDLLLNDGQVVIGTTGGPPTNASLTGTTDEIIVTPGPGTITLSTPQPIATTSSPTFSNVNVTNSLIGTVKTSAVNDLVTGPAIAVGDDVCTFDSTTGKIIKDSGIASSTLVGGPFLPLAGGTMVAGSTISNINRLVDDGVTSFYWGSGTNTDNDSVCIGRNNFSQSKTVILGDNNLANAGINLADNQTLIGLVNSAYNPEATVVGYNNVAVGTRSSTLGTANQSVGQQNVVIGYNNFSPSANDVFMIGAFNQASAFDTVTLGLSLNNATQSSVLLGSGSTVNLRVGSNGLADLGITTNRFKDVYANGTLYGPSYSRAIDNIVANTGTATAGNVASFVSDKVIQDSGIVASTLSGGPFLPLAGGTMVLGSTIFNVNKLEDDGINSMRWGSSSISTGADSIAIGKIAVASVSGSVSLGTQAFSSGSKSVSVGYFAGSNGPNCVCIGPSVSAVNVLGDTIMIGNNITNLDAHSFMFGSATIAHFKPGNNNLCDIGKATTNVFKDIYANGSLTGGTNTRTIDNIVSNSSSATVNNIAVFSATSGKEISNLTTGIGTIGSITLADTTASSSPTTGTLINAGGMGVSGKSFLLNNTILGQTQTVAFESQLTINGKASNNTQYPGITAYTATDIYPLLSIVPYAHNNITIEFDAYFNGSNLSSSVLSNYRLAKSTNFEFHYSIGNAQGSPITWLTAGNYDTTGKLNWLKPITTTDTTDSTSTSTGSIITSGGMGLAKAIFAGGKITTTDSTDATTTSTGSLITSGGMGLAKAIFAGGKITTTDSTDSSSVSTGSIITSGGIGVAKKAYVGTSLNINSTATTAKLIVNAGVQNVGTEESVIRAIGSTTATKIEIQNTTASTGKLWEVRSLSNGGFDLTDRTGSATPFSIDTNGSFGFNGASFASGIKVLFIGNASTLPSGTPTGGGVLYCDGGALKYKGSGGTVTTLGVA